MTGLEVRLRDQACNIWLYFGNMLLKLQDRTPDVCACFLAALAEHGTGLEAALFVHMYLADMAAFGAANKAYNTHLSPVNPACQGMCAIPPAFISACCNRRPGSMQSTRSVGS